jgi:uncharacterized protein YecE (DUF72 family)
VSGSGSGKSENPVAAPAGQTAADNSIAPPIRLARPSSQACIRIGISGWRYSPWRGSFYPAGLPQHRELHYASRHFPVIELNGSFYSLQRPANYQAWYEDTPADFQFAIKGPRYITHMLRLRNVRIPLANFLASGLFNLRDKLGPMLWQFPPNFKFEPESMEAFLKLLPLDTEQALRLARARDYHVRGRSRLAIDEPRKMRHAIEVRHESFLDVAFVELIEKYKVALVVADTAGHWPYREDVTSDFMYIRLHGETRLYGSGYTDKSLTRWAKRLGAWHAGMEPPDAKRIAKSKARPSKPRDIFCFFDNTDIKLRAPFDAQTLASKLLLKGP